METFENESDVCVFRSLNNSTSKRVLNLLEPVKLTVWKVVIETATVIDKLYKSTYFTFSYFNPGA